MQQALFLYLQDMFNNIGIEQDFTKTNVYLLEIRKHEIDLFEVIDHIRVKQIHFGIVDFGIVNSTIESNFIKVQLSGTPTTPAR